MYFFLPGGIHHLGNQIQQSPIAVFGQVPPVICCNKTCLYFSLVFGHPTSGVYVIMCRTIFKWVHKINLDFSPQIFPKWRQHTIELESWPSPTLMFQISLFSVLEKSSCICLETGSNRDSFLLFVNGTIHCWDQCSGPPLSTTMKFHSEHGADTMIIKFLTYCTSKFILYSLLSWDTEFSINMMPVVASNNSL